MLDRPNSDAGRGFEGQTLGGEIAVHVRVDLGPAVYELDLKRDRLVLPVGLGRQDMSLPLPGRSRSY